MPREEPFFRKCCFCIPLKSCLQVWSCLKSIADISISVVLTLIVIILDGYHELETGHFSIAHMFIILIVMLIVDSVFMLVLTIGLCTNNLRTLRVFFYYSLYMVVMESACFLGFLIYLITQMIYSTSGDLLIVMLLVCGVVNAGLDICIILTLKSEMIKLRNKQQYGFVQMETLEKEDDPVEPFQADVENIDL